MSTADHCRAMADEADRLAAIVSYGRDKVRLREQAACWRAKAATLDASPEPEPAGDGGGISAWLRRRLVGPAAQTRSAVGFRPAK